MKISIVMLAWLRNVELLELTRHAVRSFKEASGWDKSELIIVDNGSPVGRDELLKLGKTVIVNQENLGYPAGVNQGVRLAKNELIAIANNDIKVSANWRDVAIEAFEKHPEMGTLHFKMVGYYDDFGLKDELSLTGRERWCHGSFFVIRKSVLEEVGMYDEGYGVGGYDDWDVQYRIRKAGYKTAYTNKAAFQHMDSSTLNTMENRNVTENINREYFKSKFGEYPEIIFESQFGEQLKTPWKPFP